MNHFRSIISMSSSTVVPTFCAFFNFGPEKTEIFMSGMYIWGQILAHSGKRPEILYTLPPIRSNLVKQTSFVLTG